MKAQEYAVYKGDDLIVMGTAKECAAHMGIKLASFQHLRTPSYKKRVAAGKNPHKYIAVERLGEVE